MISVCVLNFVLFFRKLNFSKIDLNELQKNTNFFFYIYKSVKSYWWNIGNSN